MVLGFFGGFFVLFCFLFLFFVFINRVTFVQLKDTLIRIYIHEFLYTSVSSGIHFIKGYLRTRLPGPGRCLHCFVLS